VGKNSRKGTEFYPAENVRYDGVREEAGKLVGSRTEFPKEDKKAQKGARKGGENWQNRVALGEGNTKKF